LPKKHLKSDDTKQIANDLFDTAKHHENRCAGLAANQIGYCERIIIVKIHKTFVPMVNPEFIVCYGGLKRENEYCLSFPGKSTSRRRYKKIKVSYFDPLNGVQVPVLELKGFEARIIQHEMDHLSGILI
jgi:peptide deformylase